MLQFKKEYNVSYQQLKVKGTDSTMLGNNQMYIVSAPSTVFLWFGSEVDINIKRGALHIIKTFINSQLNEAINYTPSYFDPQSQNMFNVKFRVELQYYESQRFKSFFEKPWYDDKLSYCMMRIAQHEVFSPHRKVSSTIAESSGDQEQIDFEMLADMRAQQDGRMTIAEQKREISFKKE